MRSLPAKQAIASLSTLQAFASKTHCEPVGQHVYRQFSARRLLLGVTLEMCKLMNRFNETRGGDPMPSEIKLRNKLWFVEGSLEQPPRFG
ncbi:MAG: hypothetical protein ACI89J_001401 [Hyphomicrobiaceae bacterium]|jgi:hypothetical protein